MEQGGGSGIPYDTIPIDCVGVTTVCRNNVDFNDDLSLPRRQWPRALPVCHRNSVTGIVTALTGLRSDYRHGPLGQFVRYENQSQSDQSESQTAVTELLSLSFRRLFGTPVIYDSTSCH
jgi:hypothetical protein